MHKLSAIIITKNEELNIAGVLDSVAWADEILVVDSFSTDKTLEIASRYPVRILQRPFDNHARQKNWAFTQASHRWVLVVDADERVTEKLATEIKAILAGSPDKAAYWIYRKNYFMGSEVKYSNWQNDKVIRLLDRTRGAYADRSVHEEIETSGPVGSLKNKLIHNTYRDFEHYFEKYIRYSWWSARDRAKKTKQVTLFHLALKPLFRFFRQYILKLGFLDGKVGFIIASMSAYSVFLRYLIVWRMQAGETMKDNQ
ncbi:glycosyltransferase family 2 protein [Adhaeribacter soli]|uniref:Glycosyltransferase family 2 protein n=1 Tax=Adhaeribacter soli TaxID=2607655 RepID=A0A5N1IZ77_9BACT|nr:glycosyltransferase family 2 protein [Adhaeribacter soli]KAA9333799.1 glycosyltransferase family 2 protein [Adhaeribacter soli]